jgi:hypothetical protein
MDQGSFITKNGGIQGTFNASTSLELKTSNAPIRVDVGLHSTGDSAERRPPAPDFEMSTSNGWVPFSSSILLLFLPRILTTIWCGVFRPIDASINLLASPNSPSEPHYTIQASTSNSRLNIKFPPLPLFPLSSSSHSPILSLTARTSNAPASVSLYPTYEGRFSLQTTNHGVEVHETKQGGVEGGQGGRRRRVVMQRMGRGGGRRKIEGLVEWVGVGDDKGEEGGKGLNKGKREGEGKGRVDVRSQNALVLLEL